ncbi:MAG: NAD(P)-dependent oxidoreductase [Bacteroidales bacterium]|nr:NAD(P)-dependent oxidoreductase [Bacteroidales bacterium]
MKAGILKETKIPPDKRVPLSPAQCRELMKSHDELEIVVQPSDDRCFTDDEYIEAGIKLADNLADCDLLLGVKEVAVDKLTEEKTYLFFSHTAKEQPYNRELLQQVLDKNITLIDYEYLTGADNTRIVAFGRWAGIVGAYNGLRAYGLRNNTYRLRPAWKLEGLAGVRQQLAGIHPGDVRIAMTGGGRVALGAVEMLKAAGIMEVSPEAYLSGMRDRPVFSRLDPWHYTKHPTGQDFDFNHFISFPEEYENAFLPFAMVTDIYMACHYWDPRSPVILGNEDLRIPGLPLQVIADISCDINGPIASTTRASTIGDPLYGYDPVEEKEAKCTFGDGVITVMAVDNLPGELPRDASEDFGRALSAHVFPALTGRGDQGMIDRATIARKGKLTDHFSYLEDFARGL